MTNGMFPIAILAGGLATRLRPLTETIPKSLIDVNGEPFIAHQLRLLRRSEFTRVVICAGHLGQMIEEFVGDGSLFGLEVAYSFDGPTLLGTAGALRQARHLLGSAFHVVYGDSYLDCDYRAVQTAFERSRRKALMTVYRNDGQFDSSNVEYESGRMIAYSKRHPNPRMQHIDWGLGLLDAAALDQVPAGQPFDLADLYGALLADGQLAAYEVSQRFFEIGSPEGLADTRSYLQASESRGAAHS